MQRSHYTLLRTKTQVTKHGDTHAMHSSESHTLNAVLIENEARLGLCVRTDCTACSCVALRQLRLQKQSGILSTVSTQLIDFPVTCGREKCQRTGGTGNGRAPNWTFWSSLSGLHLQARSQKSTVSTNIVNATSSPFLLDVLRLCGSLCARCVNEMACICAEQQTRKVSSNFQAVLTPADCFSQHFRIVRPALAAVFQR